MKILKKHYKKILFCLFIVYVCNIFVAQQKMLNTYNGDIENYETQIAKEKENNESLTEIKENVNSLEYIEEIAREKLGMYLPNERVYIDINK
jgi:cell division protein FtsB